MKLVFDGTILINILNKSTSRSGVFYSIYNIFTELLQRKQFQVYLYCNDNFPEQVFLLNQVSKEWFREFNVPVINYTGVHDIYYEIWTKRNSNKENKHYFLWFVRNIELLFLWVCIKAYSFSNSKKRFRKMEAYFTPFLRVPPYIKKMKWIKKYVYLHDVLPLLFPEYYPDVQKRTHWFPKLIRSLNNEDFYFTNSKSTKNDFLKYVPMVEEKRYTVAYLACSERFRYNTTGIKEVLEKYGLPTDKKYIFSLCILDPRKNLIRAVKTFLQFIEKNQIEDMIYILGGAQVDGFLERLQSEINYTEIGREKIYKAGYIDDEDLPILYSGAEWFVYTSQYEGFGMPVLEAMSCGCPVIASNNSSLPEVVGEAGILIDWRSDKEHIEAYEKYYYDPEYRMAMISRGIEQSKKFSWTQTVDIIEEKIVKEGIQL